MLVFLVDLLGVHGRAVLGPLIGHLRLGERLAALVSPHGHQPTPHPSRRSLRAACDLHDSSMSGISWDIATPDGRASGSEALLPAPDGAGRFVIRATQRAWGWRAVQSELCDERGYRSATSSVWRQSGCSVPILAAYRTRRNATAGCGTCDSAGR